METLREVADNILGEASNKIQNPHNYVCLYDFLFKEYREGAEKVVEVGCSRGASLRLWFCYFSKAHIYGLDIEMERIGDMAPFEGRVSKHEIDQSSKKQLKAFANEHGPLFDIVIDDGSHVWSHQIQTFETLFPYVREGGLYVIEDTDTSYLSPYNIERGFNVGPISCMEYFKDIADELNKYGLHLWEDRQGKSIDLSKLTHYQKKIEWLMFSRTMIVLKKRAVKDIPTWGA